MRPTEGMSQEAGEKPGEKPGEEASSLVQWRTSNL